MRKPLAVLSAGTLAGLMALGTANALVSDTPINVTPVAETTTSADHSVYEVGEAGTVTISNDGSILSVASVNQNPGWVIEIETPSGREVEVDFRAGNRRIQFSAELEDGRIKVKAVESSDSATSTTSTSTSVQASTSTSTTVTTVNATAGVTASSTRHDAGDAGTVDIVRNGSVLEITSVNPASGWTFEIEVHSGREVELDFRRGSDRVQFNAELEDGQVRIRVRNRSDSQGDSSQASSSSDDNVSDDRNFDDARSGDDRSSDDTDSDDSSDSSDDNSSDD